VIKLTIHEKNLVIGNNETQTELRPDGTAYVNGVIQSEDPRIVVIGAEFNKEFVDESRARAEEAGLSLEAYLEEVAKIIP
jgi:hypothetical protein